MTVAFTDPRSASYLYDNKDSDESIVAPDIAMLNHMTATEIAEYLDSHTSPRQAPLNQTQTQQLLQQQQQLPHQTKKKAVTIQHSTPLQKTYKDTVSGNGWTPLSESTPMDIPPGAQPKDLLKSRLSRLAQSAHVSQENDNEDRESNDKLEVNSDDENDDDDASKLSHLQEDTPSKVRPPQLSPIERAQQQKQREIQQQQEQQLRELKELRLLKHFLLEMSGGSRIVRDFNNGLKPEQFEVSSKVDILQRENKVKEIDGTNQKLQLQIQELEEQSKKIKEELDHVRTASEDKNKTIDDLISEKNVLTSQIDELNLKIGHIKNSETELHNQIGSLEDQLNQQAKLNDELNTQIENQTKSSEREILNLKHINEELKDESAVVKGTSMSLKEMVEIKDKLLSDSYHENKMLKSTVDDLRGSLQDLTEQYDNYKATSAEEFLKVRGDMKDAVTPEKYPELLKKTPCGVPLYEDLELFEVDGLTLVQAQNMIKNVLINLGVPFSKSKSIIPGISIQLQSEDILRDFASKTHRLLYNEDMSLDYYKDVDQRGKEHLSQCTTQMYKNLELVYAVLNKTAM